MGWKMSAARAKVSLAHGWVRNKRDRNVLGNICGLSNRGRDDTMLEDSKNSNAPASPVADQGERRKRPEPTAARAHVEIDDSRATVCYSDFCRVPGAPEKLILDSGLNSNPTGGGKVEISQRLILNYFTAKRLLHALHLSVQRLEQAFGAVETDVQKCVVSSARSIAARPQS
jgi:hypothetical protein